MSQLKRNFYEILNASSPKATLDELKSNYKQLILQCHPDKLQQQQDQQLLEAKTNNELEINNDDANNLEFLQITEAWNCLKDPVKRKQYDSQILLNKFHTHNNIYAHIKLSEMQKQPNTGEYYQDGEEEEADQKKMGEEPNVIECKENELKYLYTYDCRCGGQYIVDESAEQFCRLGNNHHHADTTTQIKSSDNNGVEDDADNTNKNNNNKNNPNNVKNKNNRGGAAAGSKGIVQHSDDDDEEGGELIVECNECSLVILLNS